MNPVDDARSDEPARRRRAWLLGAPAMLLLLLLAGAYLMWSRYLGPGAFEKERFDLIVANVRAASVVPDQLRYFRVNADLDPDSLRLVPREELRTRGQGRGLINAWLSSESQLMLLLRTRDRGHAGEEGYLYWEGEGLPNYEAVASDWIVRKQVAPHWWAVYFNLG